MTVLGSGSRPVPNRIRNATRAAGRRLQVGHPVAHPAFVQRQLGDADVAGRVAPLGGLGLPGQHVEQPVGGPRHGGHRRDAEPFVDRGALGVVDAGDHALDAERLARHPRRDDVRVVARGHRREGVGAPRCPPAAARRGRNPCPSTRSPGNSGDEPVERGAVAVDDGDVVADPGQRRRPATRPPGRIPSPLPAPCGPFGCSLKLTVLKPAHSERYSQTRLGLLLALVSKLSTAARRLVLGRPFRSDKLAHTLLPKRIALPVFASDAMSSVAYAPEEIFLVLSVAGLSAYSMAPWIGVAVGAVMLVVIASYRQNVHAYPSGGGDYEVVTTNLGPDRRADGGQRAAGGLRADRRGVDGIGDVQHRLRGAVHRPAQGVVRRRRRSCSWPRRTCAASASPAPRSPSRPMPS